jgi:hypothetical protein
MFIDAPFLLAARAYIASAYQKFCPGTSMCLAGRGIGGVFAKWFQNGRGTM